MRLAAAVLAVIFVLPSSPSAWGFEAHRFIADRMIALLPAELKPLFEKRRAFVVERAIDPDLWRTVGWEEEPPNHFLDMDYRAFGPYPFTALPRDYDQAVQKFGKDVIHTQGLLPWRAQEFYGRLQREFESLTQKQPPGYALDNIVLYAAVLTHYVSDGHVPLHAVVNYNGQLTNQTGLHSRWESELFERNRARLRIAPVPITPVANPRDFMFETLLASHRASANVLESDSKAAAARQFYDDGYFEAFGQGTLPVLEKRLNEAIASAAAMIAGAWESAGRPGVPVEMPRTPRPVRRQTP